MSKVSIEGNALGTGTFTIAAPNSNTSYTLTLPESTGTMVVTGGAQTIEFADGSASTPSITNSGDTNTGIFFPAADTIGFAEGGAEAMRVDSTGRLLVGTSTGPSSSTAQGDQARIVVQGRPGVATSFGALNLARDEATPASDNVLGYLNFTDSNGDVYATISGLVDNTPGSGDYPGRIVFQTVPNGSSTRTERMRIDSSGRVKINTTGTVSTSSSEVLAVDAGASGGYAGVFASNTSGGFSCLYLKTGSNVGFLALFYRDTTPVGSITTNGTTTSFNTSSDYRLKENIAPMTGALERVAQLKPCIYTWKANGSAGEGFVAHELQEVVPHAVFGDKDGEQMQGVDYGKITPLLTAALQEALAKIEMLETRIAALETK